MEDKKEKALSLLRDFSDLSTIKKIKEEETFHIGDALKAIREARGLTQEQLAEKLGYGSKSTINKLEKNINGLSLYKLLILSEAIGVSPQIILDASGIDYQIKQIGPEYKHTKDYMYIEQTLHALNTEQLKQLRTICETVFPMPKTLIENSRKN